MKRTMFQLYLKDCQQAIELYKRAFDAKVSCIYYDETKTKIEHAEIIALGQCIAFSERDESPISGNTMQFCFHLGEGYHDIITHAYKELSEGALIEFPLGKTEWSNCVFGLVDKFGVNWCLFE